MCGLTFRVGDVLRELSTCASLVSSRNTAQSFGCVMFSPHMCEDGVESVSLTVCDSDNFLSVRVPVVSVVSDTRFCVSVVDLLRGLRNLDAGDEVEVELSGSMVVFHYPDGVFMMPSVPVDDFPRGIVTGEEVRSTVIDSDSLLYALDKTSVSIGSDPIRPIINSVNFKFSDHVASVASTDGQRLVRVMVHGVDGDDGVVTIPSRPSGVLRSVLRGSSRVHFRYDDRHVTVTDGNFVLTSRLSDGNYPKYESIMHRGGCGVVTLSKSDLVGALRRIIPMGNTSSNLVVMNVSGDVMELSSEDAVFQKSARERIPCVYDGAVMEIGFNGSSLLGMVTNMVSDDVCLELRQPNVACILRPRVEHPYTECVALLMPMSIM